MNLCWNWTISTPRKSQLPQMCWPLSLAKCGPCQVSLQIRISQVSAKYPDGWPSFPPASAPSDGLGPLPSGSRERSVGGWPALGPMRLSLPKPASSPPSPSKPFPLLTLSQHLLLQLPIDTACLFSDSALKKISTYFSVTTLRLLKRIEFPEQVSKGISEEVLFGPYTVASQF